MIAAGIRAKVTCVDGSKLDRSFAGREFSQEFVESLPPTADPCGEYGEFHTFVYEAPVFAHSIPVETGEIVEREGFIFADVVPTGLL
jgi:diphthamide synthase (EF-2-diphthine--ammonia ligase)